MHPLVNIAIKAARQASEIIFRSFENVPKLQITEKAQNDYVTEVDLKAEAVIIETILKAYPSHNLLTEERGEIQNDPAMPWWIIDPLDGTRNFMHGFPHFAVSIGVRQDNKLEHGVIYDPVRNELFTATRGKGALLNNRRLRVSTCQQLSQALLSTGFPFRKQLIDQFMPTFISLVGECGGVRRAGAAALDLAYVAAGRLDGYWELGLSIWDLAAGALMVKEAGGLISDMDGSENYLTHGAVIAANPKIFKMMLQKIQPLVKAH